MEWLNQILEGVENADELAEKIRQELPKSFVPKERYNELAKSKRAIMEKQGEDNTALLRDIAINSAVKAAAKELKIKDAEVIKILLDKNAICIGDDGSLSGFDEQIKELQDKKPYLFGADALAGRTPYSGGDSAPITRAQFEKMGYRDRFRIFEEQPEVYRSLIQE